jgi:hypothetical protein
VSEVTLDEAIRRFSFLPDVIYGGAPFGFSGRKVIRLHAAFNPGSVRLIRMMRQVVGKIRCMANGAADRAIVQVRVRCWRDSEAVEEGVPLLKYQQRMRMAEALTRVLGRGLQDDGFQGPGGVVFEGANTPTVEEEYGEFAVRNRDIMVIDVTSAKKALAARGGTALGVVLVGVDRVEMVQALSDSLEIQTPTKFGVILDPHGWGNLHLPPAPPANVIRQVLLGTLDVEAAEGDPMVAIGTPPEWVRVKLVLGDLLDQPLPGTPGGGARGHQANCRTSTVAGVAATLFEEHPGTNRYELRKPPGDGGGQGAAADIPGTAAYNAPVLHVFGQDCGGSAGPDSEAAQQVPPETDERRTVWLRKGTLEGLQLMQQCGVERIYYPYEMGAGIAGGAFEAKFQAVEEALGMFREAGGTGVDIVFVRWPVRCQQAGCMRVVQPGSGQPCERTIAKLDPNEEKPEKWFWFRNTCWGRLEDELMPMTTPLPCERSHILKKLVPVLGKRGPSYVEAVWHVFRVGGGDPGRWEQPGDPMWGTKDPMRSNSIWATEALCRCSKRRPHFVMELGSRHVCVNLSGAREGGSPLGEGRPWEELFLGPETGEWIFKLLEKEKDLLGVRPSDAREYDKGHSMLRMFKYGVHGGAGDPQWGHVLGEVVTPRTDRSGKFLFIPNAVDTLRPRVRQWNGTCRVCRDRIERELRQYLIARFRQEWVPCPFLREDRIAQVRRGAKIVAVVAALLAVVRIVAGRIFTRRPPGRSG